MHCDQEMKERRLARAAEALEWAGTIQVGDESFACCPLCAGIAAFEEVPPNSELSHGHSKLCLFNMDSIQKETSE